MKKIVVTLMICLLFVILIFGNFLKKSFPTTVSKFESGMSKSEYLTEYEIGLIDTGYVFLNGIVKVNYKRSFLGIKYKKINSMEIDVTYDMNYFKDISGDLNRLNKTMFPLLGSKYDSQKIDELYNLIETKKNIEFKYSNEMDIELKSRKDGFKLILRPVK